MEFSHTDFFAQRRKDLGYVVEGLIRLHWHNLEGGSDRGPAYIECGCMRDRYPFPQDDKFARSTLAAARALHDLGGAGVSLDIYSSHIQLSQDVLADEGYGQVMAFIEGPSVLSLENLAPFPADVILLDSDSDDGANAMAELEASKRHWAMQPIIIVDDINRNGVNKGKLVLEWATQNRIPWKMVAPHVAALGRGPIAQKTIEEWCHWCPMPTR